MLPEHDVAQFRDGALEVDDLDLDLLQSLVVQSRLFNVVPADSDADTVTPAAVYRQERGKDGTMLIRSTFIDLRRAGRIRPHLASWAMAAMLSAAAFANGGGPGALPLAPPGPPHPTPSEAPPAGPAGAAPVTAPPAPGPATGL